jgi:hypothetical protein
MNNRYYWKAVDRDKLEKIAEILSFTIRRHDAKKYLQAWSFLDEYDPAAIIKIVKEAARSVGESTLSNITMNTYHAIASNWGPSPDSQCQNSFWEVIGIIASSRGCLDEYL